MPGNTDKTVAGFRIVVFCRHSPSLSWSHLMLDIFINGHSLTLFIWSSITSHCVLLFHLPCQLCSCCVFLNSVVFSIFLPIANLDFDSLNHAFWILKSIFKLKLKPIYLLFTMPSLRELSNTLEQWSLRKRLTDRSRSPVREPYICDGQTRSSIKNASVESLFENQSVKVNDPDRKSGSPIVMMVRHARVSRTFWPSHFLKLQVLHHIDVKIGLSLQLVIHLFSPRSLQPIVFRRVALQRERSPDPILSQGDHLIYSEPFPLICCTRISRTCIYCKLILRWKTAFTSSCLPCRGGHCVCETRYSCGPEFLLTSWFKQSIRCRGPAHGITTLANEASDVRGQLETSNCVPAELSLNCWTSRPFSCVYVANLRLSQKSEFPTVFPTRLTRILDLGTLKAWATSSL